MDITCDEGINNMTNKEAAELIKNLVIKTVDGRANGKSIHSAYINAALIKAIEALRKPDFVNLKIEESKPMLHSSLSVAKLKRWDKYDGRTVYSYEVLYEHISDPEDALLLAQLAMCDKYDSDLIIILPGWNYSIDKKHEKLYKESLRLAEKHKYEPYKKKED